MITKNTSKIFRFLLRNLDKTGHNINQIAKEAKISVGSSFKILKELEKRKLVVVEAIGNAFYYNINLGNLEASKICELLLLEEKINLTGYAKLYAESLQEFNKAEMIILFGSVLTKKEFNDIDVLFMTDKVDEVSKFCLDLSKTRTKPIVPLIVKKKDLIKELRDKKAPIISIFKYGVVLKGESSFLEVIQNAKK